MHLQRIEKLKGFIPGQVDGSVFILGDILLEIVCPLISRLGSLGIIDIRIFGH